MPDRHARGLDGRNVPEGRSGWWADHTLAMKLFPRGRKTAARAVPLSCLERAARLENRSYASRPHESRVPEHTLKVEEARVPGTDMRNEARHRVVCKTAAARHPRGGLMRKSSQQSRRWSENHRTKLRQGRTAALLCGDEFSQSGRRDSNPQHQLEGCVSSAGTPVNTGETVGGLPTPSYSASSSNHEPAPVANSDPDLAAIAAAWPDLPPAIRAGIVAMVGAATALSRLGSK